MRAAEANRAFDRLAEPFRRELRVHCYRMMGSLHEAEDLVQEAFLAVWNGAAGFSAVKGSVRTWVLGIVHHRAIDRLRQGAAIRRRQDALEQAAAAV